jgi:alpha-N-arabinofuranosidase
MRRVARVHLLIAVALVHRTSRAGEPPLVRNGGFEETKAALGWEVVTYGAAARVERDETTVHGGRSSLRISAGSPSDTAIGQNISLEPGKWYRLRGWVRTRGLRPMGAPVYGTFIVQRPPLNGAIASGENHGGDTEWTEVVLPFVAPTEGLVRISGFFVGFGRGEGNVWFDDVTLEAIDPSRVPVTVTLRPLVQGRISPMQYGQFIEYLCDLVPGMWAEKLCDGSFEGLSPEEEANSRAQSGPFQGPNPYEFHHVWQTDFRERRWYPSGAVNRAAYSLDPIDPVSPTVSKKIAVADGPACRVGLSQDHVRLDAEVACTFSCFLRQDGIAGPVRVELRSQGATFGSGEMQANGKWTKFSVRLTPPASTSDATLSISFRGPGTLWIDNASLMPEDSIGGWRRDVVEAVRALKPGIIRFGGSALEDSGPDGFDWRATVGDPDRRKPFRAWGGLQPIGPGLEEIVQFCRAVQAEPLICVRYTQREPNDAAEEIEYFNGAAETPMGKLRAAKGHPEPYGITFWQVGNEIGERSNPEYGARLKEFCEAMRRVDPTIKILSSYPSADRLRNAGRLINYTCPHQYAIGDLAGSERELVSVARMIEDTVPGAGIKIGVTEWNTTAGDAGFGRATLWNLSNALACSRYHNLLHRHCDMVEIANRSNLTNSFCSGILQTIGGPLYLTPTYYAQRLFATLAGDQTLALESELPTDRGPDLSATLAPDGKSITLFAVNDGPATMPRKLNIPMGRAGHATVKVWQLADRMGALEPDATNGYDNPARVSPVESSFEASGGAFDYRFPAYSLSVLRWDVDVQ